jgi:hypothetical protein
VEGWVSERTLRHAADEFRQSNYKKIVIGSIHLPESFMLHSPGALVFPLDSLSKTSRAIDTLSIRAYSTPSGGAYARMHVFVNQQEAGSQMTTGQLQTYHFPIQADMDTVRQISVHFRDDHHDWQKGEDRNLYVHSVQFGTQHLHARDAGVYYDRGDLDGEKIEEIYSSRAGSSAEYLMTQGIPASGIHTIDAPRRQFNKTYTTGLAISQWLSRQDDVQKINLITESTHARRSWLLYRKALPKGTEMGIIASTPSDYRASNWWKHPEGRNFVWGQTLKFFYAVITYPFI